MFFVCSALCDMTNKPYVLRVGDGPDDDSDEKPDEGKSLIVCIESGMFT